MKAMRYLIIFIGNDSLSKVFENQHKEDASFSKSFNFQRLISWIKSIQRIMFNHNDKYDQLHPGSTQYVFLVEIEGKGKLTQH